MHTRIRVVRSVSERASMPSQSAAASCRCCGGRRRVAALARPRLGEQGLDARVVRGGRVAARLAGPERVEREVHRDAVEPGERLAPAVEPVDGLVGADEGLLRHVLCLRAGAHQVEGEPEDAPLVAADQRRRRPASRPPLACSTSSRSVGLAILVRAPRGPNRRGAPIAAGVDRRSPRGRARGRADPERLTWCSPSGPRPRLAARRSLERRTGPRQAREDSRTPPFGQTKPQDLGPTARSSAFEAADRLGLRRELGAARRAAPWLGRYRPDSDAARRR